MSDFSLTLVLQFKTSKIINDVAKVQIKSEKITPFGGIFHVRELFSRYVGSVIDKVLGPRCTSYGYQSARSRVRCQASTSEDEAAFHAYEDFSVFCDFCETSTKLKIIAGGTPTSLGTEVIVIC